MKIDITIGIPAHNEEKRIEGFLSDLSENLLPLSRRNLSAEIIVVANGCVDQTVAVVENFARSRGVAFSKQSDTPGDIQGGNNILPPSSGAAIRLIVSEVKSKAHAWNVIYGLSTSDFLFFFDADVKMNGSVVERMYNRLQSSPELFSVAADVQPVRTVRSPFHSYLVLQEKMARSYCRQKISGAGYVIRKDPRMITELPVNLIGEDAYLTTLMAVKNASPYADGINKLFRDPEAVIWHSPATNMKSYYQGTLRAHCGTRQNDRIWGSNHKAIKDQIRDIRSKREKLQALSGKERLAWLFLKPICGTIAKYLTNKAKGNGEKLVSGDVAKTYSAWSTSR